MFIFNIRRFCAINKNKVSIMIWQPTVIQKLPLKIKSPFVPSKPRVPVPVLYSDSAHKSLLIILVTFFD